jgi:hypothetical protein
MPPFTAESLKHRYRELVTRWHPDQFQSDPQGRAEAEIMMRNINVAYKVVAAELASAEERRGAPYETPAEPVEGYDCSPPFQETVPQPHPESAYKRFKLSSSHVDAIVKSIDHIGLGPGPSILRMLSWSAIFLYAESFFFVNSMEKVKIGHIGVFFVYLVVRRLAMVGLDSTQGIQNVLTRSACQLFGWLIVFAPPVLAIYQSIDWGRP